MPPYSTVYFVVCNLSSKSPLYSDIQYPKYLKYVTCSIMFSFTTIFTLLIYKCINSFIKTFWINLSRGLYFLTVSDAYSEQYEIEMVEVIY